VSKVEDDMTGAF